MWGPRSEGHMSSDSETRAPFWRSLGRGGEINKTLPRTSLFNQLTCCWWNTLCNTPRTTEVKWQTTWKLIHETIVEEGFIEIYQEPTHFILIILVSLFQLFYQSCWNTIKWLMFNPLLVPLSGRNTVSGKRPKSWMVGKGKWYVFISWIKCPWPDKVQQGHPWDWAFGAPSLMAGKW